MAKEWTIPTVLRELRRVVIGAEGVDIMDVKDTYKVSDMVEALTEYHMHKEMEIPGQTAILIPEYTGPKETKEPQTSEK